MHTISLRHVFISAILFACASPSAALAHGYSEYENHRIWELRVAAAEYASTHSKEKCGWAPSAEITYSDQFVAEPSATNNEMLFDIMSMLRLDQNARAISNALGDDDTASSVKAQDVDSENLRRIKKLFSERGFPNETQVGESGVGAMLLLVAHADKDLEFQRSVLMDMEAQVNKGELSAIYPVTLKAIRPKLVQAESSQVTGRDSSTHESRAVDASRDDYSNPSQCFYHERNALIDWYIRARYDARSDSAGTNSRVEPAPQAASTSGA